ncbi:MAG: long-chain fatty acid transporter [Alistipes sp.]|nr:long-chain fatty acid transporter [Alistipes sp.]
MKKIFLTLCTALMLCSAAKGEAFDSGGLVIDPSTITAFDIFNSSTTQFSLGTARSAAMAGAMTSLGADASSMSINPAGMGMYRSNEIVFTPMMTFSRAKSNAAAFEGNSKNRFGIGNFSMVAKLRESSTGVTAINMGIAYNRLADFNYKYSFATQGTAGSSSIADIFAGQLAAGQITSTQLKGSYDGAGYFMWDRFDPTYWGAILGYKTGLINDSNGGWGRDMIGSAAGVDGYTTVESKGSAGEWVWSLGMNFGSKFYLGFSLGAATINRERHIYYGEGYSYTADPALNYQMEHFNYDQVAKMKGTGVNFKIGAIYRPIESLRIGVAFHTPTYYSVTYSYQGGMTSEIKANNNVDDYKLDSNGYIRPPFSEETVVLVDDGDYSWSYTSPTRLMFGVSYTIAKQLILSVDYERDWYNSMRLKDSPYGALYKGYIKDTFKGSNTVRAGAEWRFIPQMAVRMGYGLWSGALTDNTAIYSSPVTYRTEYMSAGFGVALSKHFTIDATYQFCKNNMTPYKTFYGYDSSIDIASPTINTTLERHNLLLSLTVHF